MLDRSDGVSLRTGFFRNAATRPTAPAVWVRGQTRTYGELERTARRWANALLCVRDGQHPRRIGLFAYRSETAYTGTLSAFFAGARYVPLNPTFPPEKAAAMAKRQLPPYIVPKQIYVLDQTRLNVNEKVDRRALQDRRKSGELAPEAARLRP